MFGSLFIIAGIVGCLVPFIPGPPLGYLGFVALQFKSVSPYSNKFLVIWAVIVLVVTVLDYVIPVYGTKRFGGSMYGIWGCTIGLIIGVWFGPIGIIFGPFLGALAGELINNQDTRNAMRSAFGSFVGFLFSTLLKLIVCLVMAWYFITAI